MKSILRYLFNVFLKMMPAIAKSAMIREWGISLGIQTVKYNGKLGVFAGSIHDRFVFDYYLRFSTWAPGLQSMLETIFQGGSGTYIDVGANIGLTTIPIARKKDIQCFVFEPEVTNYSYLSQNILANGVASKVKAFNMALYSDDCSLEMELSDINSGDNRIRIGQGKGLIDGEFNELSRKTVRVSARRLDGVVVPENVRRPVVMKVDTQGAEVRVFQGAGRWLAAVDYLIVEYWPYALSRVGDSSEDFFKVIRQFQYGAVFDHAVSQLPKLLPVDEVIRALVDIPENIINKEGRDLVLSRSATLGIK